ncbi:MAG: FAD-dependent oxidoreductase [Rhodothermales bacterium]|nr:FAD-dependent oxidoreductase [Rhodothermales bacterium]
MVPDTESTSHPVRIAIIGAGPAGFYASDYLLRNGDDKVEVDLYDRLPTPHGLVRAGVAPDHEKIKNVTRKFEKTAEHSAFRFFGNVDIGVDITVDELKNHYHQILFTTGAQVDRRLGIPGEDLPRSYSATEFVAWYNGHPDYSELEFDLSVESAVIVGVGNVAVDVARILCRTTGELRVTDIADYAIDALAQSNIREVHMLGRRGPAQAAFTNPEIKELGEMADADLVISPRDVDLDPATLRFLEDHSDRIVTKKLEILTGASQNELSGKSCRLFIHFLTSPTALKGDDSGVTAVETVRNELYLDDRGSIRPRATDEIGELKAGVVFRSVGYRGVAVPGVPFRDDWGTIPHDGGRILDAPEGSPVTGLYAAGWIKRGPSGVIGTNKADAVESAQAMLEDAAAGVTLSPSVTDGVETEGIIRTRVPDSFSWSDWRIVDEKECARGAEQDRPRVKFTSYDTLVKAKLP